MDFQSFHAVADGFLYVAASLLGVKLGIDAYCLLHGIRLSPAGIAASFFAVIVMAVTYVLFCADASLFGNPLLWKLVQGAVIGMIPGFGITYVFGNRARPSNDHKEE